MLLFLKIMMMVSTLTLLLLKTFLMVLYSGSVQKRDYVMLYMIMFILSVTIYQILI